MEKYIEQLIQDITRAHRIPIPDIEKKPLTFEEEMEEVENYATGQNIPPILSIQSGLKAEQFPPAEQLTDMEIMRIIDAFDLFLESYNIAVSIPEQLPLRRKYPLFLSVLNHEAWFFSSGTLCVDFCTGYAPDCELGEYCNCLEFWKDHEKDPELITENE